MITLAPSANHEEIKNLFRENGMWPGETAGCVIARTGDEVLGYSLYDLTSSSMTIRRIVPDDDLPLADGILRSTLHVAVEHGVMKAFYCGQSMAALAEKLDFIKNKNHESLNIDKLFQSCHGEG